jgi:hypothetical protein
MCPEEVDTDNPISKKAALVSLVAVLALGIVVGCGSEGRKWGDGAGGSSPGTGGSTSGTGATAGTGGDGSGATAGTGGDGSGATAGTGGDGSGATAGTGGDGSGGDPLGAAPGAAEVTSANGRMSGGGYTLTFQLGRPTHQPRAAAGDVELTCAAPVR